MGGRGRNSIWLQVGEGGVGGNSSALKEKVGGSGRGSIFRWTLRGRRGGGQECGGVVRCREGGCGGEMKEGNKRGGETW